MLLARFVRHYCRGYGMRFRQLDSILELKPNEVLRAKVSLTGKEGYLVDHFPLFPVMPGVIMLEALYQAGMWLVQNSEEFAYKKVMAAEVKNAKFADFVEPGDTLEVEATLLKKEGHRFSLKTAGKKGDVVAVSARMVLEGIPFCENDPYR